MKKAKSKLGFPSIQQTRFSFPFSNSPYAILGVPVDPTGYEDATRQILEWGVSGDKKYLCVANVHMIMEAHNDYIFRKIIKRADLVTPDGMPLVWTMRLFGEKHQTRVYGPTLTRYVCQAASESDLSVGFYGGSPETVKYLVKNLSREYPDLRITYAYSPPFRPLNPEEDREVIQDINNSGTKILFVGLGCPSQEHWMFDHLGKINAVMMGVGAAFDFHAGTKKQAPNWMMAIGLEWLFRLCSEPRRLWKRYLYNNPRFMFLVARQILKERILRN